MPTLDNCFRAGPEIQGVRRLGDCRRRSSDSSCPRDLLVPNVHVAQANSNWQGVVGRNFADYRGIRRDKGPRIGGGQRTR